MTINAMHLKKIMIFTKCNLFIFLITILIICPFGQGVSADNRKNCDNSSCQALSEAVLAIVGKISIPRPTSKTFKKFSAGSAMPDIFREAGIPTKDVGSGIYVLIYEFEDGNSCTVGTDDLRGKAMYVHCD